MAPVALLTNGVFIVTGAGFELTTPALSRHPEPLNKGTTPENSIISTVNDRFNERLSDSIFVK